MNLDALSRVFSETTHETQTPAGLPHPDPPDPSTDEQRQDPVGPSLATLRAAAGDEWPLIADNPAAITALSRLLQTAAQRDRGERPEHYTRPAHCGTCGDIWLWDGAPARLLACPWCLATAAGATIPRPTQSTNPQ